MKALSASWNALTGSRLSTWVPTLVLVAVVLGAVAAPWLAPFDPSAQLNLVALKNAPPSVAHWLGTDSFSRDVFSRSLFGARTSLQVGLVGALIAVIVATAWGAIAGLCRDVVGTRLMSAVDVVRAIPHKVIVLAVMLLVQHPTALVLAVLLGATSWTNISRVIFVQVRALRSREFVTAARAIGASPVRVMWRHVTPHLSGTVGASSAMLVADMLAAEAGLSFLGLGVRPPVASWGTMLQDGVPYLASAWWVAATPCVLLVVTVLSIARVADTLQADRSDGRRG